MPVGKGKRDLHVHLEATWAEYAIKEAATRGVSISELIAATLKHWRDPDAEVRGGLADLMTALRADLIQLRPTLMQIEAMATQLDRIEQRLPPVEPARTWGGLFRRWGNGNRE